MTSEDERAEKFLDEMHRMPSPVTELAEAFKEHATQKRNEVVAFTPDQLAEYAETVREEQLRDFNDAEIKLGAWMSAALSDPSVCDSMKVDITRWFTFFDPESIPLNATGESNDG